MRRPLLLLLLPAIALVFASGCEATKCPAGWLDRAGTQWCYQVSNSEVLATSWQDAKAACQLQHGELVSVQDTEERNYILSAIKPYGQRNDYWWIGLQRQSASAKWMWDDGHGEEQPGGISSSSLLRWWFGTSGNTGNCIAVRQYISDLFMFVEPKNCNDSYKYICKKMKQDSTGCDTSKNWRMYGSSCYKATPATQEQPGVSWSDARAGCRTEEADLVSVPDRETNAAVLNVAQIAGAGSYWIGLKSYAASDGHEWRWTDDSSVSYESWQNGKRPEVSQGQEDNVCVRTVGSNADALWGGYSCSGGRFGSVCRKAAGTCARGWYQHRDACYLLAPQKVSWDEADSKCRSYGANLLQVKQRHKQTFINSYREEFVKQNVEFIWIGLFKSPTDAEMTWTSGGRVEDGFTNWADGQPNFFEGRDNAARMIAANIDGRWEISRPEAQGGYVCEIPLGTEPKIPTTPYPMYTCNYGWHLYSKSCYRLEWRQLDWLSAEKACRTDYPGAALIDIRDAAEQEFIQGKLFYQDYWIGLHARSGNDRTWVWSVDNSRMTYDNWEKGQPDNHQGQESCVEMYQSGTWNDNVCTYKLPYICKVPANFDGSPPTPRGPVTTTAEFDPFCGPGWRRNPLTNYCYLFIVDPMIWVDAKHQCEFQGGSLLSITSDSEKMYITGQMQAVIAANPGILSLWMGFNDRAVEGRWVWDDGAPVTYLNWAAGEPNNQDGEDCGTIFSQTAQWNDEACGKRFSAICKKLGNGVVTTPPPLTTIEVPDGYERGCPTGYESFRSMCYAVKKAELNWNEALKQCRAEGGDLASVMEVAENQFLMEIAKNSGVEDKFWIGFHDTIAQHRTMFFQWSDNSVPTFTNWHVNEPNNEDSKEDCVELIPAWGGEWNDISCVDVKQSFACKRRQVQVKVTLPTTVPPGCGPGYTSAYQGYCLKFVQGNELLSAEQVGQRCRLEGGTLVTIPDQDMQNHLMLQLTDTNENFWIGIVRFGRVYIWDDRRRVTYMNFVPGHNVFGARGFMSASTGQWDMSSRLFQLKNYICQALRVGFSTTPMPPPTFNPANCAHGWVEVGNMCFRAFHINSASARLTWSEARVMCQAMDGDLASVTSENITEALKQTVVGLNAYWIGLNSRDSNKDYVWADGQPTSYYRWRGDKQPENINDNQNCVQLEASDMQWTLANCNAARNWLCQAPKGVNPTGTAPPPTTPPDILDCGSGWSYYNGFCYQFSTETVSWHKALRQCRDQDADLTSVLSQEENDFLLRLASKLHLTMTSYWIGLNELGQTDGFRWTDGSPANYFNWNTGEPNNHNGAEHCVSLYANSGFWNDEQCGVSLRFVCKRNNDTTTPPPPTPLTGNCPKEFRTVGDKCFRVYEEPKMNWTEARIFCEESMSDRRTYLASIANEYEQAALVAMKPKVDLPLWIGLHSRGARHDYYWNDNSEFTYSNWAFNEPSSIMEQCVEMYTEKYRAGKWNDAYCRLENGFVCMTYKDPRLSTAWPPPTSVTCRDGWVPYGKSCYRYEPQSSSWKGAVSACTSAVSQLVSIHDVWENNFVHFQAETVSKMSVWTGLSNTDSGDRGLYQWSDDWPVTYTNWADNNPNETESDSCVYMDYTGRWLSGHCGTRLPYLCRSTSEPAPTAMPEVDGTCPDEFLPFGSSCYYFAEAMSLVTAQEAQFECRRRRSGLVSILSPAEQQFVAKQIKKKLAKLQNSRFRSDYWIGMLRTHDGGFEWEDGNPVNFAYWSRGEPSNTPRENCVEIYHSNLKWNDHYCNKRNSYVCKTQKTPSNSTTAVPTTTTTTTTTTTRITATWTKATDSPGTQPPSTRGPMTSAIRNVIKNNGLVATFVVALLLLLVGLVLGAFFYRRRRTPPVPETAFSNANWSRSSDGVEIDGPRARVPVQVDIDNGLQNPTFGK